MTIDTNDFRERAKRGDISIAEAVSLCDEIDRLRGEQHTDAIVSAEDGNLVKHTDYAALEARCDGLERERNEAILKLDYVESLRVKWMMERTDLFQVIKTERAGRDALKGKLADYKTTHATSLRINEENNNLRAELSQAYDERNAAQAKLVAAEETTNKAKILVEKAYKEGLWEGVGQFNEAYNGHCGLGAMGERMMKLDEISKLLGEITQGEWSEEAIYCLLRYGRKNFGPWDDDEVLEGKVMPDDDDAKFIAAAPTIIRDLAERVRLLKDALTEIKTGEVEVWDDGEAQIVLTNMDEEEMQKIAADALGELAAKEST